MLIDFADGWPSHHLQVVSVILLLKVVPIRCSDLILKQKEWLDAVRLGMNADTGLEAKRVANRCEKRVNANGVGSGQRTPR